jgi:hypothetical protein
VRKDSLSFHHGTERVNAQSLPTKAAKPNRRQNNTLHPKNCRCEACKAYLQLIKELNPKRFEELTKESAPITRPASQTKRHFASEVFGLGGSRVAFPKSTWKKSPPNQLTPPDTTLVRCTCGKTSGFTGLHKRKCALMRLQSAIEVNSPQIPIIGCTCGKTFGFAGGHNRKCALVRFQLVAAEKPLFETEAGREVASLTVGVLQKFERLLRPNDLRKPENVQRIVTKVRDAIIWVNSPSASVMTPVNPRTHVILPTKYVSKQDHPSRPTSLRVDVQKIVSKTIGLFIEKCIEIPKVVLVRNPEFPSYEDFELDLKSYHFNPRSTDGIGQSHDQRQCSPEVKLEDYIVRGLVDFEDVSYDHHHELLHKLARAVVRHLQSRLANDGDVRNVLQFQLAQLANVVHRQMQWHKVKKSAEYDVHVTGGFTALRSQSYFIPKDESHRDFRFPADEKAFSRGMPFGGFKRCLSPSQRFQSDAERRFAMLLEDQNDPTIVKWIKPEKGVFQIYDKADVPYQPDFLVETRTCKLICDLRNLHQVRTDEQEREAEASARWCEYATEHEKQNGGKAWSYLLIPEHVVKDRPIWALWRTQLKIESPTKFERLFG